MVPSLQLPALSAGHSRLVVGVEQRKSGALALLVMDPGSKLSLSTDAVSVAIRHIRKFPSSLKHKQYQLLAVQGVLSAEDKQVRWQRTSAITCLILKLLCLCPGCCLQLQDSLCREDPMRGSPSIFLLITVFIIWF